MLPPKPEALPSEAADATGLGYAADQGGMLTANTRPEPLDGPMEALAPPPQPGQQPLLSHDYEDKDEQSSQPLTMPEPDSAPAAPAVSPLGEPDVIAQPSQPAPTFNSVDVPAPTPSIPEPDQTLTEIEQSVHSPHAEQALDGDIDSARDEVLRALQEAPTTPEPITALNAQPVIEIDHDPSAAPTPPDAPAPSTELHVDANGDLQLPSYPPATMNEPAPNPLSPADQPLDMPLPPASGLQVPPPQVAPPTNAQNQNPNSPPPVPPPMLPPM